MIQADTPMPGEDPGALIEEPRDDDLDPTIGEDIETNPQPRPMPVKDETPGADATEQQRT